MTNAIAVAREFIVFLVCLMVAALCVTFVWRTGTGYHSWETAATLTTIVLGIIVVLSFGGVVAGDTRHEPVLSRLVYVGMAALGASVVVDYALHHWISQPWSDLAVRGGGFLVLVPPFVVLDFTWITIVMQSEYRNALGDAVVDRHLPRRQAGLLTWGVICGGLIAFAVHGDNGPIASFLWGFAFGLASSSFYALTNLTVLKNYNKRLALLDIGWGSLLAGAVTTLCWLVRS